jgi:antitoxin MazE
MCWTSTPPCVKYILCIYFPCMETRIQKWGNSLGLRVPKDIADRHALKEGSRVRVRETKKGVMIEVVKKPTYHLEEMLKAVKKTNVHEEVTWGTPAGKELW